ncbi:hypothetical protein AS219_02255 [Neorickettsia sp. 179522]|nr:hypothetical protein AS219_02255 [Neorickettsia sp. 179522]
MDKVFFITSAKTLFLTTKGVGPDESRNPQHFCTLLYFTRDTLLNHQSRIEELDEFVQKHPLEHAKHMRIPAYLATKLASMQQ